MIIAIYILKVNQIISGQVFEVLNTVTCRAQFKSGCLQSSVWKNDNGSEFMVYEIWTSKRDLEKHIGSSIYRKFLEVLEISIEKPSIRFTECDRYCGIELVEEVINTVQNKHEVI